jgi:4-hydroxy-2-oxoheptanedioate aldolase
VGPEQVSGGDALRARFAAGGPSFGVWCALDGVLGAEIAALAGFDWACADFQHGAASLDSAAPLLQAISATGAVPLARVPANDHWLIGRALDLGAAGVIVPMVNDADEARHAVDSARYPPAGTRSFGPVRASANAGEPVCIVMCETCGSVERLAEICAVEGVDGVYIGPRDLALSHGLEPGPELERVIGQILAACVRAGVPAGIHTRSGESARRYAEAGFRFAAVGSDRDLLARTVVAELQAAQGNSDPPAPSTDGVLRAVARYV